MAVGVAAAAIAANAAHNAIEASDDVGSVMTGKGGTVTGFKAGRAGSSRPRSASGNKDNGVDTGSKSGPPSTVEEAVARRVVSLQVEWCTVSAARAGNYVLPHGAIVKRKQADIAHLEVYRVMWEDEAGRWSLGEELRASYDR